MALHFTNQEHLSWPDESCRVELWLDNVIQADAGLGESYGSGVNTTVWDGDGVDYDEIRLVSGAFQPANVVITSLIICD